MNRVKELSRDRALVFLSPGLFGFREIGSISYFGHLVDGIQHRFRDAGVGCESLIVATSPTASLRHRAGQLRDQIGFASRDTTGPIHLVGHSSGGLDARLVVANHVTLEGASLPDEMRKRFRSLTTINTPHRGTPLARFFATGIGARVREAVFALTARLSYAHQVTPTMSTLAYTAAMTGRVVGRASQPLTWVGRSRWQDMEAAYHMWVTDSGVEGTGGMWTGARAGTQARLLSWLTEKALGGMTEEGRREVRSFLRELERDQSAVLQLAPESMEVFDAAVPMRDDLRYQSVASYVPSAGRKSSWDPWTVASSSLFVMLEGKTGAEVSGAPFRADDALEAEAKLIDLLSHRPPRRANDGVVPLRSQVFGDLIWAGIADHQEIIGHFHAPALGHAGWMGSASGYGPRELESMIDSVVKGMLKAQNP